ncbi:putative surface-anchored protein [Gardnerella vaginalis 6119V5]|uniref:SpaH/EbpB family LPXTG-anchored major pilin n=1 Tax=Gardnerella vaginalis TaxID=2702 RepID=UPI00026342D0|nr:SpaH/EbpB family LPXTG-anchored major pilin [Gardnerella vaginalis]EIK87621.1 putative surface-anchored protein [Gardnerella vaginalis 6119V5]
MNNFTKRCVAAFASLTMAGTLCAAGAVTVSSVAWGEEDPATAGVTGVDKPSQAAVYKKAPWELTETEKTANYSLTVYKWENEVDSTSKKQKKSTPVSGAEFTVKKVTKIDNADIDLTKYADWVKVANKIDTLNKREKNPAGITFETGNGTKVETKAKGVAKFDLGIGLYKVTETKVPKGYSASESKPFYITIPSIEKDGNETKFNYAPFADPKNKNLKKCVKKTADTSETIGAGDKIKYTISAELDKMKEAGAADLTAADFNGYSVVDLAPAKAFTAYTADVVKKVTLGAGEKPADNDTTLDATDYTVTPDAQATGDEHKITISFTPAGTQKLVTAANDNAGKVVRVFVTLEFTLTSKSADLGTSVTNKGGLIPSHADGDNPDVVTGEDNEKVEFSKFKITKVSATSASTKLKDAKFKLFADKTKAEECSKAITANSGVENACAAASKGFDEKTTGTTGETEEYSLVYKKDRKLYLVETVAPTGYIRNPDAVEFTVEQTATNVTFQNLPTKDKGFWFNLPKTGAAGVILFALAGVCFVGSGFVVYIHRRKKEEEQAKLRA